MSKGGNNYHFFLSFLLLFIGIEVQGQVSQAWRYNYPEFDTRAENQLLFRLENNNFMKNNEYFGEYVEGYTLLGYAIQPSVMYYAGSRLRFKAGLHLLEYSGVNKFTEVIPVISVHAKLTDQLDLIMGALRGDVHHEMLEPLFDGERQYFRPVETGLQFIYNSPRYYMDTWLDWEQFIFNGDEIPEKFTAGVNSRLTLTNPIGKWDVSLPFQMVATHLGGQISDYTEEMQSLANIMTGLRLSRKLGDGFLRKMSLATYFMWYQDLTQVSGLPFDLGQAFYPVMDLTYKYGDLMFGYWQARNFIAPKGSPLFQSISMYRPDFYNEYRYMATGKLSYTRTFLKQIKFSLVFEGYYDIPASQFDYAYGVNLVFTPNFSITKIAFN
ncbi:hypothetical protein DMA11_02675 [Marinilabiliaceae bacterium JC017]|nr:hypothetical protein DMA11_02675 [Marinilabiliaceae bacterium JC017]